MNLILGLLWLCTGVALLAYEWSTGRRTMTIRGTNLSAAWLLFLLAAYNLVRWWSLRSARAERRALAEQHARRQRESRSRERPEEWNPELDFTRKAPPPPNGQ
jgi:hypothetical protein